MLAIGQILKKEKSISFNLLKPILQNKGRLTPPFILYKQIFSFSKLELLLDSLFNGVAIGSVLLVAALGLAIVFGLMGVINLAHGELMMLGAYTTYVTQLIFKLPILKPFYNSYIIVSIFLAFIVSGVVGILLEKTIIRKLYGSPLETLLATWGVSLILQQFVRSVPLAYGTGLVISLLIGLFIPTTFSSKIKVIT